MNKVNFQSELTYQVSLALGHTLFKKGIISIEDFQQFKDKLIEKYHPIQSRYVDVTLDK